MFDQKNLTVYTKPSPIKEARTSTKRYPDLSLSLFVFGITIVFFFYIQVALGIDVIRFINLKSFGYGFLLFSLFFAIAEGRISYLSSTYQKWFSCLLVFLCFLLILGIIHQNPLKSLYFTSCDLFSITMLSGILIGSKPTNRKVLEKTLMWHFAIATFLCIFSTLTYGRALLYSEVVTSPVYKFWGLLYAWPYFLATLNSGGFLRKIISLVGVITYFLLSIFFLKRTPFAKGILLIGILFVFNLFFLRRKMFKKIKFSRLMQSTGFLILIAFVILAGIRVTGLNSITEKYGAGYGVRGLYNRFMKYDSIYELATQNYRIAYEAKTVFETASNFDIVFGRGLGATIPVSLNHSREGRSGELHNGMAKIILKGGLLFFMFWYFGWFIVIKDAVKYRERQLVPYYSIIIMTVLFSLVAPFLNNSLSFVLVMLCAGRCMSKSARPGYHSRFGLNKK